MSASYYLLLEPSYCPLAMIIQSLDPRVTRLGIPAQQEEPTAEVTENQFITFQVFTQTKEDKPFEHAGIVHAPNTEMALIFAKEQYSRRFICSGLAVANTASVKTTAVTEAKEDIYDLIQEPAELNPQKEAYEIFHLNKRGKQTVHAGSVEAGNFEEAAWQAKKLYQGEKPVYNLWLIRREDVRFIDEEDKDIWATLADKNYRDAISYKATDKLKAFKAQNV